MANFIIKTLPLHFTHHTFADSISILQIHLSQALLAQSMATASHGVRVRCILCSPNPHLLHGGSDFQASDHAE